MEERVVYWFGNSYLDSMINNYSEEIMTGNLIRKYQGSIDLSTHGSSWYETHYEIKGDNGNIYSTEKNNIHVILVNDFIGICKKEISNYEDRIRNIENVINSINAKYHMS